MGFVDRSTQVVSFKEVLLAPQKVLDRLAMGEDDHMVMMRDDQPAAVFMNVAYFESLMNMLSDLQVDHSAVERLSTFNRETALSHDDLLAACDLNPV